LEKCVCPAHGASKTSGGKCECPEGTDEVDKHGYKWCACPKEDEGEEYNEEKGECEAEPENIVLLRKKSKLQTLKRGDKSGSGKGSDASSGKGPGASSGKGPGASSGKGSDDSTGKGKGGNHEHSHGTHPHGPSD